MGTLGKRKIRILRHCLGAATSAMRGWPTYVILGAMKCGTKSLFEYLAQHPGVRPPVRKEISYYDVNYAKGTGWYLGHFPWSWEVAAGCASGEASPGYLFHPQAARRIHADQPGVKLIALLRNPTDRALSHYRHEVQKGREKLSVTEAMAAEEARIDPGFAAARERDCGIPDPAWVHASYKARGLYLEQLERYQRLFPRERILVVIAEDLFRDPRKELARVFAFLGLDPDFQVPDLRPQNTGRMVPGRDDERTVRASLDAYFAPHNAALEAALGRKLPWGG